MRPAYKLLSVVGDVLALLAGPGPFVRRKARQAAHRQLARTLRKVL